MRTLDFSPLFRSTVGFDRLVGMLDQMAQADQPAYPPYNIERTAEHDYRITMAVAGFAEADLSVEVRDNVLTVTGKRDEADGEGRRFLHQGIAGRAFERRFQLAENVEVRGARLENGLLHIELVRVVPEHQKPRRIAINGGETDGASARVIEGAKAA